MTQSAWVPPFSLGDRLKYALVPPRLYIWRLIRKNLRRGEPELHVLARIVPRGRNAIDVGANKGVYTHLLARLVPQVEAFEVNPKIYGLLVRCLPPNVVAHQVALSDRTGMGELIVPKSSHGYSNQTASLNPRKRTDTSGIVKVVERTLDSFGFSNVGFIKIDVEGFESAVVRGARETILRERPVIQIELEEFHTGRPLQESIGELESLDMAGFYLRGGKLLPLSGFDVAANRKGAPGYINNFIFRPKDWRGPAWD